jgi:hypothetical protein
MTYPVSTPVSSTPPPAPDWTLIEVDYRAGIKALRTIADEHGISHTAITKRAKREGWLRDLTAKTRARADALVYKAAVSNQVSTPTGPSELATVEANATLQYQVRIAQRRDIARARRLWERQINELDLIAAAPETFEWLGVAVGDKLTGKERGELVTTLKRVTALSARISSLSRATDTLEKLIRMERQAFGISSDGDEEPNETAQPGGPGSGQVRGLSDAERAIRLARLFRLHPAVGTAVLPGIASTTPIPPDRPA